MAENWWEIIEILIMSPVFTANEPNQWWNSIGFCIWIYITHDATYEASENDEISIIAIGFNTNEPNYMNTLNVAIHRHSMKYVNDEISAIATAFIINEPEYGENSGNICVWPYIRYNICTKHDQRRIYDEQWRNFEKCHCFNCQWAKIKGK